MTMKFTGTRDEAFKLWTDALRSGEYEKGIGMLNSGGKFCCLGVLCEVLGVDNNGGANGYVVYNDTSAVLPVEVSKFMEMGRNGDFINGVGNYGALTGLNDYSASTFSDIADIIEKNIDNFEPYSDE